MDTVPLGAQACVLSAVAVATYLCATAVVHRLPSGGPPARGGRDPPRRPPPRDGGCAICLADARAYAAETSCGHLYCSACILLVGARGADGPRIRCPLCRASVEYLLQAFTDGEWADDRRASAAGAALEAYNHRHRGLASWWVGTLAQAPRRMRRVPQPALMHEGEVRGVQEVLHRPRCAGGHVEGAVDQTPWRQV